jgi:hypothetical protein
MTSTIHAGLFAAMFGIATVGMTAQTPQPPTQPPPPTQQTPPPAQQPPAAQPSTPAPGDIVVIGCLKEAPASAADAATPVGTSGAVGATPPAASAAPGPKYILSDATISPSPSPASETSAATPPPASASASAAPQTYRLLANASALTPHLGKKLELVGTLETNSSEPGSSAADASGPALRVKSGKIVAASCTP